ncbi:3-hydroxyacyl-CoA dehydrogenase NAD-binding domain-containing protein [Pseudoprimorskyibacter insulae]|nr:3-hydroxyacyl-CoA dehydrogenase NAD-binding domain-containing protein [Pseudoprimorskyibacter insulae]
MGIQQKTEETASVSYEHRNGVAILTIDNPPVNAGSHGVRMGVVQGIERATAEGVSSVVLIGAGRCFVAGSDLKEFGKPLQWPQLPDVIAAIEAAPFPVIAALHGVALGGGLELALGCDYRIAATGTKVGLPEVSLGFVPGAGGTQRLPRLVGLAKGIELICNAARIDAQAALAIGLVDAMAQGDLLDAALAFAIQHPTKRPVRGMTPPAETAKVIDAAAQTAMRRGKGRPNVAEAIRLVRLAAEPDMDAALAEERAVFQAMRVAPDAVALRYLFFAERRAAMVDGLEASARAAIATVGVIGGGTMGQGIARAFLQAGLSVRLVEREDESLTRAISQIGAHLDGLLAKGRIGAAQRRAQGEALIGATDYAGLADCDLVIEAVFEDMAVKREVLARLEPILDSGTLIATNTSYLDIDQMGEALARPDRLLGLHFFSPADVMPLLEVVRAGATSDTTLATGLALARKLGKQPVVARVGEGFIGNRIYAAYRRRAELLVLDGAAPEDVDAAATAFGFAMGPFAVSDMSGLDIAWAMRKRQAATRPAEARYVAIPDRLCEAGRLGRKTGKGWYNYSSGKAQPDPEVEAIIRAERAKAGITPLPFDMAQIQRQLLAAIVNEAACLLSEGIAQRASDVDVVFVNGYGFPRWRGGPLYWASLEPAAMIAADLADLAGAIGFGHTQGPVAQVLDEIRSLKSN